MNKLIVLPKHQTGEKKQNMKERFVNCGAIEVRKFVDK